MTALKEVLRQRLMKTRVVSGLHMGLVAIAGLALVALPTVPTSAATVQWSIGTSGTGSGPYIMGGIIAKVLNKAQNAVKLSPQSTGGYNDNLGLVATKKINLGMTYALDLDEARTNTGRFREMAKKQNFTAAQIARFRDLRPLFSFYFQSVYHWFVRADSDIYSLADLKGKKVNLHTPTSSTRRQNVAVLEAAGLSLRDIKVLSMPTGRALKAFRDRIYDAGAHALSPGSGLLQEVAVRTPIRLLDIPDDVFAKLNKKYTGALTRWTIAANTYNGQTKPARSYSWPWVFMAHKDADPNLIYVFSKAFWENVAKLVKANKSFRGAEVSRANPGSTTPLHPGAARYLREVGVLK